MEVPVGVVRKFVKDFTVSLRALCAVCADPGTLEPRGVCVCTCMLMNT